MAAVLAARARGEAYNPLRSVIFPPGRPGFMGLMPAYAGGEHGGVRAQGAVPDPVQPRPRPGHPPGDGDAVRRRDGHADRHPQRLRGHRDPHRRRDRRWPRGPWLAGRPRAGDPRRRGPGPVPPDARWPTVRPWAEVRVYAPTAEHAQALAARSDPAVARGRCVAPARRSQGADVVVTATSARQPVLEHAWLATGRARQRRRRQHPDRAGDRNLRPLRPPPLFCDSRESVRNEAGEYRQAVEQGLIAGEEHIRAELGEVLAGAAARADRRRRADACFARWGSAVEDLAAAQLAVGRRRRRRARHRGGAVIELAEIEAARERIADIARAHAARPPARRRCPGRDPCEARDAAADQLVQDPRRRQRHPHARHPELRARGLLTASAGNMAQGVAWVARELGLTATIAVPEHAPEAKLDRDRAAGRPRPAGPLRRVVAGDRHQPDRRGRRGCSCIRWPTRR